MYRDREYLLSGGIDRKGRGRVGKRLKVNELSTVVCVEYLQLYSYAEP